MPASFTASSPKRASDIIFSPDVFGYFTLVDDLRDQNGSLSGAHFEPAPPKKTSERHVRFQEPKPTRRQTLIHPLFRERPKSRKAGDITPLDHQIARHGGTTSSYEELPHRLKESKQHEPLTDKEQVVELTYEKSYLLKELACLKDTRAANVRFLEKVAKLRGEMEAILIEFDSALEERSREQARAESELFSYWGIEFSDGSLENVLF
ncbi:MAG: hypothetical protein MMC33_005976 [Icmadophila ericetorum]|nr:hypothetical protein [Icmadophila ericetorum]